MDSQRGLRWADIFLRRWLWKEKLCEKARKHMCVTDRHDMTLSVKVALNPNTTNQPTDIFCISKFKFQIQIFIIYIGPPVLVKVAYIYK